VTLLVTPDEAERLTLASTEGKIQLALRNPVDTTMPETHGIRPAVLLGLAATMPKPTPPKKVGTSAKAAPAAAPAPVTVEIIRGDKRTREAVREE
jgi:pilus assembly protein CpaB